MVVTEGIKLLLSDITDIQVKGEARTGQQALDILGTIPIDVALMDIEMPVMDGIRCTELISQQYPEVKVISISIYADYPHVQSMIKAGAKGYLLKNCGKEELEQCIRKVHTGGTFFSDDLTDTLLAGMQGKFVKKEGTSQFLPTLPLGVTTAAAVPSNTTVRGTKIPIDAIFISKISIFLPRYSGVRPTINPAKNTATMTNRIIP
jgi:DNA-binding NarL/FixJ family response regulator